MSRVVDGAEPMEFKALFKAWKDKYENTGMGKKYSGEVTRIAMLNIEYLDINCLFLPFAKKWLFMNHDALL